VAVISEVMSAMNQVNYCPSVDSLSHFQHKGFSSGFAGKAGPGKAYAFNKQVHAADIVEYSPNQQNAQIPADGIWTKSKDITIAVRTADCLPVLFVDKKSSMAMAVHAGWRGLCSGILNRAVDIFEQQGINKTEVLAAVGPAISRERYEVGPEVISAFYNGLINMPENIASICVAKGKNDRWFLDLQTAAMASLLFKGIDPTQLSLFQICTWSDDRFFSYRREGKGVGSNISWISLT